MLRGLARLLLSVVDMALWFVVQVMAIGRRNRVKGPGGAAIVRRLTPR